MDKVIITKQHEDFTALMLALEHKIFFHGCQHNYNCFYMACEMVELYRKRQILIDRDQTLNYLRKRGGFCDCEILLNAQFDIELES